MREIDEANEYRCAMLAAPGGRVNDNDSVTGLRLGDQYVVAGRRPSHPDPGMSWRNVAHGRYHRGP
jgi:hypothetical protein